MQPVPVASNASRNLFFTLAGSDKHSVIWPIRDPNTILLAIQFSKSDAKRRDRFYGKAAFYVNGFAKKVLILVFEARETILEPRKNPGFAERTAKKRSFCLFCEQNST